MTTSNRGDLDWFDLRRYRLSTPYTIDGLTVQVFKRWTLGRYIAGRHTGNIPENPDMENELVRLKHDPMATDGYDASHIAVAGHAGLSQGAVYSPTRDVLGAMIDATSDPDGPVPDSGQNGNVPVMVNLTMGDDQLRDDFAAWLREARRTYGIQRPVGHSLFTEKKLETLRTYRVLPYWDIQAWLRHEGDNKTLADVDLGDLGRDSIGRPRTEIQCYRELLIDPSTWGYAEDAGTMPDVYDDTWWKKVRDKADTLIRWLSLMWLINMRRGIEPNPA